MNHPSYLELDRLALGGGDAALHTHVESCERCAAHLEKVRLPEALPTWLAEVAVNDDAPPLRRRRIPFRFAAIGAFAAAAAALAITATTRVDPPTYVGRKGMPSVALYLLRDGKTSLWNGVESLRPGDRIRLKIAPEGYRWIAVSHLAPDGSHVVLHRAAIDDGTTEYLLPQSWRLDEAPGPERLHVALDDAPADPTKASWTTTLEIPKEAE